MESLIAAGSTLKRATTDARGPTGRPSHRHAGSLQPPQAAHASLLHLQGDAGRRPGGICRHGNRPFLSRHRRPQAAHHHGAGLPHPYHCLPGPEFLRSRSHGVGVLLRHDRGQRRHRHPAVHIRRPPVRPGNPAGHFHCLRRPGHAFTNSHVLGSHRHCSHFHRILGGLGNQQYPRQSFFPAGHAGRFLLHPGLPVPGAVHPYPAQ